MGDSRVPALAKIAYDGYKQSSGGKSLVSGDSLPDYENLPPAIKAAWESAVSAVLTSIPAAD